MRRTSVGDPYSVYRLIFLQAIYYRGHLANRRAMLCLLAVMLVLPIMLFHQGFKQAWAIGILVPLAMLTFIWWNNFINSMILQANLARRHLIPQLPAYLLRSILGMWVLLAVLVACAASVALGQFFWMFCVSGLGLTVIALTTRIPWLFLVFAIPVNLSMFKQTWVAQAWAALGLPGQCGVFVITTLLIGTYTVRKILAPAEIPVAGNVQLVGQQTAAEQIGARLALIAPRSYLWWLRRAIRTRQPGALLLCMLRPASHWHLWGCGMVFTAMATTGMYFVDIERSHYINFMSCLIMCSSAMTISGLHIALGNTQQEQGLLRLAPLMPRGRKLNRLLAQRLLLWCASSVAATMVAVTVMALLAGSDLPALLALWSRCGVFLLPFGCIVADYSGNYRALRSKSIGVLSGGLILVTCFGLSGWPWPIFGVVSLCVLAAWFSWRWSRMVTAPVAFPTGRNAERQKKVG